MDRLKTSDSGNRERLAAARRTERRLIADADAARLCARDLTARLTREAAERDGLEKRLAAATEKGEGWRAGRRTPC